MDIAGIGGLRFVARKMRDLVIVSIVEVTLHTQLFWIGMGRISIIEFGSVHSKSVKYAGTSNWIRIFVATICLI